MAAKLTKTRLAQRTIFPPITNALTNTEALSQHDKQPIREMQVIKLFKIIMALVTSICDGSQID